MQEEISGAPKERSSFLIVVVSAPITNSTILEDSSVHLVLLVIVFCVTTITLYLYSTTVFCIVSTVPEFYTTLHVT
jgi:hypothetical protein